MRFAEFPFLRYSVFFISGILAYPKVSQFPLFYFFLPLLVFFILYLLILLVNSYKDQFRFKSFIPILAYFQLFILGLLACFQKDISQNSKQLINCEEQIESYLALVLEYDEPKPNSSANRVSIKKTFNGLGWQQTEGEVLLYHRYGKKLTPGDLVWIGDSPQRIHPVTNPFEFDYAAFLLNQQISHQHFVKDHIERIGSLNEFPIESFFMDLRARIMAEIDKTFDDPKSNQIAKALLLGQKKNMDKEISEAYATAGAMHVLAVSGLHVGIIYGFFFLFLKPQRLSRPKRVFYLSLLIVLIWSYALFTGMSPSVMRAATMFSLMALAQMSSRNPSIFNAIALSAIIILLFNPFLVYSVGFQLSYSALIGIVLIQPLLVNLWLPKLRVLEYVWQITTVGLAAQIATFPISAYYFHSFPVYFLISNLVAIPGAFLIMSFGIPFMLFHSVHFLGQGLAWITEKFISYINYFIFLINELPFSKISEIYLSPLHIALYFVSVILLFILWHSPGRKLLYSVIIVLLAIGLLRIHSKFEGMSKKEIVWYGLENGIALDIFFDGDIYSFQDLSDKDLSFKVQPNRDYANPNSQRELVAFQSGKKIHVFLPGNLGSLILEPGQLDISNLTEGYKLFLWEKGKWEVEPKEKLVKMKNCAQKIVLN
ncbi:ComEC/Rec2 family competence protein [Shivajiella indica]|uniref:ComEC/Rec2 family competence protein n=1 Tax=Shivajiella indica TaxID=872115 RepID=A0ABW5B867_9BACT